MLAKDKTGIFIRLREFVDIYEENEVQKLTMLIIKKHRHLTQLIPGLVASAKSPTFNKAYPKY